MITIVVADDQSLIRGALASLLELETDFTVVGQAGTGTEAIAQAKELRPTAVVMDIEMPELDGIAATAAITQAIPETKVLIVTTFGRPGYLHRAMEAGASGFIVKDTPAAQLAAALRKICAGQRVIDPDLAAESLLAGANPLTAREQEVLRAAATGATVHDVAREVCLSEGTVRNHLSAAIGKTGARTRAEAARLATENGWL